MRKEKVMGKVWWFSMEEINGEIIATAKKGKKKMVEVVDKERCRLDPFTSPNRSENIDDKEHFYLFQKVNEDLGDIADSFGYDVICTRRGYDGTFDDVSEDKALYDTVLSMYN